MDLRESQDVRVFALAGVGVATGDHGLDLLGDHSLDRVPEQVYGLAREQGRVLDLLRTHRVTEVHVEA